MFKLDNIKKIYKDNKNEHITALDEVSLSFENSGLVVINGASGCGKTTLLNILGGLDEPTSGEVYFNGEKINDKNEKWWDDFRRENLGFVYQDFNLLENITVLENIQLPLSMMGIDDDECRSRIDKLAEELGILEYLNKKAGKLSGGQKQRVAIARAVVSGARILLADEPTGNLDRENSETVFKLLKKIADNHLVIIVTHDDMLANKYADRLIKITYGKIESDVQINQNLIKESKDVETTKDKLIKTAKNDKEIVKTFEFTKTSKNNHLPIKLSFQFAKEAIALRKVRCIISVLIFSITLLFTILLSEALLRDDSVPLTDYVESKEQQFVPIYLSIAENFENVGIEQKVTVGKKIYELLISCVDKSRIIQYGKGVLLKIGNNACFCNDLYVSDANEKYFSYEGTFPKESNEVAITYAISKKAGLSDKPIGAIMLIDSKEYVVTAVITKVAGKEIVEDEADNDYLKDIAVFSTKALEDVNHIKSVSVPGLNVIWRNCLFDQTTVYNNVSSIDEEATLVAGRMPESDNEVVINKSWFDLWNKSYDSVVGKEYKLYELYESEYENTYWGVNNLTEYIGYSIKVVGVVDKEGTEEIDYFVTNSLYKKLCSEQMMYYTNQYYLIADEEYIENDIYNINKQNIKINISELDKVYDFMNVIDKLKVILLVVCLVIAGLCVLQMISLYSYSIEDNKKTIGILRTMGVNKSDTLKIFTMECIVVSTISFVIAVLMGIIFTNVLNNMISSDIFRFEGFGILHMRFAIIVGVGLINFILSALSVITPIRKCQKMKIIQLLK